MPFDEECLAEKAPGQPICRGACTPKSSPWRRGLRRLVIFFLCLYFPFSCISTIFFFINYAHQQDWREDVQWYLGQTRHAVWDMQSKLDQLMYLAPDVVDVTNLEGEKSTWIFPPRLGEFYAYKQEPEAGDATYIAMTEQNELDLGKPSKGDGTWVRKGMKRFMTKERDDSEYNEWRMKMVSPVKQDLPQEKKALFKREEAQCPPRSESVEDDEGVIGVVNLNKLLFRLKLFQESLKVVPLCQGFRYQEVASLAAAVFSPKELVAQAENLVPVSMDCMPDEEETPTETREEAFAETPITTMANEKPATVGRRQVLENADVYDDLAAKDREVEDEEVEEADGYLIKNHEHAAMYHLSVPSRSFQYQHHQVAPGPWADIAITKPGYGWPIGSQYPTKQEKEYPIGQ